MPKSVFGRILAEMLCGIPGANCAILADWEGEAVDHAGSLQNTNIQLLGAHWGIVYSLARTSFAKLSSGILMEVILRLSNETVIVHRLTDDCYVVVSTSPDAQLSHTLHSLDKIHPRLMLEI